MYTKRLVKKHGMKTDPAYYSGNRARLKDLNSTTLENMLLDIEDDIDDNAAKNFVQMIKDMPNLCATAFLKTLYNLEENNWTWDKQLISDNLQMDNTFQIIYTAVRALLNNPKPDQTTKIKESFLEKYQN